MASEEIHKATPEAGAESPTTAQPLDMDDDDVQDSSMIAGDDSTTKGAKDSSANKKNTPLSSTTTDTPALGGKSENEAGPTKPPRPMTEAQKSTLMLKEAFPAVDDGVIRAVLSASGGRVEPAFNALLEMTDPEAIKNEPVPPPQPPRRTQQQQASQLEADERYARQLAQHYDNVGAYENRTSNRQYTGGNEQGRVRGTLADDDNEHSFIDDDLPVIRDNLRKGFQDTQTKVNGWINQLKKRIEDNFDESPESAQGPGPGESFRRHGGSGRPSGDYDADPQVLSDDFAGMRFSADGTPAGQGLYPQRTSSTKRPGDGRRVAFQEETEEINMYDRSPNVPPKDTPPTSVSKASKWQPLSAVEPSPITDNDPFSLGDSDDEKETKDKPKDAKETKGGTAADDENERLKKAAAEAMADSLVDQKKDEEAK